MRHRVIRCALALSLALGTGMFTACSPTLERETEASASASRGAAFGRGLGSRAGSSRMLQRSGVRVNHFALSRSTGSNTRVVIDISKQRAYLLVDGAIAVDSPVSTARPGKYTPRGSFRITERVRQNKYSTIYRVEMPYWMRLNNTVFGLHAGHLPGHPASAGCIRLPDSAAQIIFDNTRRGTRVNIYTSWNGA